MADELKTFYMEPSLVIVKPDRFRKEFNREKLEMLKGSIKKHGQIQPIVLDQERALIAGERRLRSCTELGIQVQCIYREDIIDPILKLELELEENLMRDDLTPQEEVIARAAIHEIKVKIHGETKRGPGIEKGWGIGDTAELLGKSIGATSEDIKLGKLVPVIPELQKAKTKSEMKKVLKTLSKRADWNIKAQQALEDGEAALKVIAADGESVAKVISKEDVVKAKALMFDKQLRVGNALEALSKEEINPNLVIFDPPWGVGLHDKIEGTGVLSSVPYEDDVEMFQESFPKWCKLLFNKMAMDSHLYVFFGIVHFTFVFDCLEKAGFEVNRRPIIWVKPGMHSTRQPDRWPGASYEPIAFARKGKRDLVRKLGDSIVISGLTVNEKGGHPSAKPYQVYINLLQRSAYPGDLVIDPMFGTGACFQACEMMPELNLKWLGWDKVEAFKNIALVNILKLMRGEQEDE